MKKPRLFKDRLVPLSGVLIVGWQFGVHVAKPLGVFIWNASAAFTEMRAMVPKVEHLENKYEEQTKIMAQYQTTQTAILQAMKDLKKPIVQVQAQIENVHSEIKQLQPGPVIASPFHPGPFGAR